MKSARPADKAKRGSSNGHVAAPLFKGKNLEKIRDFIRDEDGLETVEYAIILGLVVAATIGLIGWLGGWVESQFTAVQSEIGTAS